MNRDYQLFEITRSPHIRKLYSSSCVTVLKIVLDSVNSRGASYHKTRFLNFPLFVPNLAIVRDSWKSPARVAISLIFLYWKDNVGVNNVVFFRNFFFLIRPFFKLIRIVFDLLAGNSVNRGEGGPCSRRMNGIRKRESVKARNTNSFDHLRYT